jgi:hypothetical protein
MITWYHQVLSHVGIVRLYQTIITHFVHPHLKQRIEKIVKSCDACLRSKLSGMGYGELPPRQTGLVPWNEVAVDLIGSWTLNIQGAEEKFNALTCIDPVSNLVEIAWIHNKTAAHAGTIFKNSWVGVNYTDDQRWQTHLIYVYGHPMKEKWKEVDEKKTEKVIHC